MKRAVIMADGKYVTVADLGLPGDGGSDLLLVQSPRRQAARGERSNSPGAGVAEHNISRTAELLGITRPTLYDLLEKNAIVVPERTPEGYERG